MNQRTIFSDEVYKEDPTQSILDWLQPFTVNLEDLEMHVLAHSSEREISDSEGDASKIVTHKWEHNIHTHFRKYQKRPTLRAPSLWSVASTRCDAAHAPR